MIDLDQATKCEPLTEIIPVSGRTGEFNYSVTIGGMMGFSTESKWGAADDLRSEIEVQIERLLILKKKVQRLCEEFVMEENQ